MLLAFIALCSSAPAHAQLRSLANPGFESNNPAGAGAPNYEIITNGSVVGWDSTTGEIELWDTTFNSVPSYSGSVHAEMNANVPGTLYQNICLVTGEPLSWTFAHRARSGGSDPQVAIFEVANSSGTLLQSLTSQSSTIAANAWAVNAGSTTYTGPTGNQRVQFRTTNPGSFGNFLDGIQLTLRPFIQLSAASSSGVESIASANIGTLRVSGTASSAISVTVTVTGGTATLGTDYTTPSGGPTFTVTVPAGTYYDSAIPLGITVTNDSLIEGSETIALSFSTGTGYTVGHTTSCGTTPQTTSTYTITDDDSRVTLRKQWANAAVGDDANVTVARGVTVIDTLASNADSNNELDTDATPTPVVIGETVTLAETLVGGNVGSYTAAVACTGAADTNLTNGLTIGAGETDIICTYTNSRVSQQLRLAKAWGANSGAGHSASATTTGGVNAATFSSTASTATNGAFVTVYSGEVITLPAETYGGGAAAGNYTVTLACTGGTTLASGAVARTITIANNATNTTCTYTNTRIVQQLRLAKTWVNRGGGHTATATTTGGVNNASFNATAGNVTGAFVNVFAGEVLTLPAETFGGGATAAGYVSTLVCTGGTTLASGSVGRTITIADNTTATTCTYTNSRGQLLSLAKVWGANSFAGHTASATTSGGTNNATFTSTASTNTTGTAVLVLPGEVVTLPAETYGGGATSGHYTATLACTGGTTLANGATGRTITISTSTTATTCTYTNTRRTATLTLRKTWVNAIVNNAVTVSTTGLTTNGSLNSIANTANETDSGAAFTVYMGDTGTIGESFSTGSAGQYNAALTCTGNNSALSGSALTINPLDTAIICTMTNTFITPISVAKSSSTIADGISLSNPKSIPGATVRYCIVVTNPGTLAATSVMAADALPPTLTYVAGTLRSGTNCINATTVEDDDNSGADESDPVGISVSGSTIAGSAPSLSAGGTFSIVFDAIVN
jgi:trimeric autotransporter adhesin